MTREEAKQIIATWLVSSKGAKGQRGYIEGWFDEEDVEAFRMAIEALSAEVRHGKWEPHPNPTVREYDVCTVCGIGAKRRTYGVDDGIEWMEEAGFPYCPNCGAKMDKE